MRARLWIAVVGLSIGVAACIDLTAVPTDTTRTARGARSTSASSPQLLSCPTTDSTSTTGVVGLLGGVLSLAGTSINIPAGAVLQPTLFQIVVPPSPYMEVEIHAVGLTTFLFHQPVSVTIDYSRCGAGAIPDGAQLQGVYIDSQSNTVLEQMGGTNDSVAHRVTFSTGHLSGYAVAY